MLLLPSLVATALLPAAAALRPLPAPRWAPSRAPAPAVAAFAALPPGSSGCAATPLGLASGTDASGYGAAGLPDGPVLIPATQAVVFLTVRRRPIPRVTAVTARTFGGRTLWVHPLPPGVNPSNVTAFDGALALALQHANTAIVVLLSPRTGRTLTSAAVPWPPTGLGPYLTVAGGDRLLLTGSPVDLPAALGGLGPGLPGAWALTANLRSAWHRTTVGRLLALAPGVAIWGALTGARDNVVVLQALDLGTGRTLWARRVVLPDTPTTATFLAEPAAHALVTAVTWSGGGRLLRLDLTQGSARWTVPTRRSVWVAAGSLLVGAAPPWQALRPVAVRSLTDGRAVSAPAPLGFPVASLGTWVLLATPVGGPAGAGSGVGTPSALALSLVALGPPTRAPVRPAAMVPAGAPPYTIVCTPQAAYVFTPWIAGAVAKVPLAEPR